MRMLRHTTETARATSPLNPPASIRTSGMIPRFLFSLAQLTDLLHIFQIPLTLLALGLFALLHG